MLEKRLADLICNPSEQSVKMLLGYYNDDVEFTNRASASSKALCAFISLRSFLVFSSLVNHGRNTDITLGVIRDTKKEMFEIVSSMNPYNLDIDKLIDQEERYFDEIKHNGYSYDNIFEVFASTLPFGGKNEAMRKIFDATVLGIESDIRYIMSNGRSGSNVVGSGCLLPVLVAVCVIWLLM